MHHADRARVDEKRLVDRQSVCVDEKQLRFPPLMSTLLPSTLVATLLRSASLNALVQRFSKYSDEAAITSHDELST